MPDRSDSTCIFQQLKELVDTYKKEIAESKSVNHWEDQEHEDWRIMGMEEILHDLERMISNVEGV